MDDRDRTIPQEQRLADQFRQGLHVENRGGVGGEARRAQVSDVWRCAQAAIIKLADKLDDEKDARRQGDEQLHERCSAILRKLEGLEGRLRIIEEAALADERFEAGRKAEILSRREQEALERGQKSYWIELGKFALALVTAIGTVFGVIWAAIQLMLQAQ